MTELELCGRDEEHGLAQREIRTHKDNHHSRPVYLCDDCAARIDPNLLEQGMTVTITPLRGDDG
jgi:uncharacterized protein YlaI